MTSPPTTPRTWPDGTEPTADEFLPWFLAQTEEAQVWMLHRMRAAQHEAHMCHLYDHEGQIAALKARVS